jgi:methionyl-tRNA formyltransferase
LAAINLHPSLLPRWRGAAPIERALMAGDKFTGVMVIHIAEQWDAGDIVLSRAVPIPATADAGQLRVGLAARGGELLVQALDLLSAGRAPRIPQGDLGLLPAPKLTPSDEVIEWREDAVTTVNRVRALAPRPGAHFIYQGQRVSVLRAEVASCGPSHREVAPGSVLGRQGEALLVAAGQGTAVALLRVKPAGGREMAGSAYANGRRLVVGELLPKEDEG